jgi:hypothetical protein
VNIEPSAGFALGSTLFGAIAALPVSMGKSRTLLAENGCAQQQGQFAGFQPSDQGVLNAVQTPSGCADSPEKWGDFR